MLHGRTGTVSAKGSINRSFADLAYESEYRPFSSTPYPSAFPTSCRPAYYVAHWPRCLCPYRGSEPRHFLQKLHSFAHNCGPDEMVESLNQGQRVYFTPLSR